MGEFLCFWGSSGPSCENLKSLRDPGMVFYLLSLIDLLWYGDSREGSLMMVIINLFVAILVGRLGIEMVFRLEYVAS